MCIYNKKIYEIGYKILEIDFCPSLKNEKIIMGKENILRWYSEIPLFIKKETQDVYIFPKILNLDYGVNFQLKMIESAIKGKV